MEFFSTVEEWVQSVRQTALDSTRNKIIASIATSAILMAGTITLIKVMGSKEHKAKKNFESQKRTPYDNKLPKGDNLEAPEPGKIFIKDFRNSKTKHNTTTSNHIRIITWNIERGYRTNEIIQELQKIDADIILLQEVDIGTIRTGMLDVGNEIANALKYQIIYGTDCWHVNDYHENDPNAAKIQYNSLPHNGCEGNAILTRFNIIKAYPVIMPCVRNSYRPYHADMKRHTAVVGIIDTGISGIGELVCYSLHMDAFSGRVSRSNVQYKAIYRDIIKYHTESGKIEEKDDDNNGVSKKRRAVVVGGDFNTHNHGLVRFVNEMSGDDELRYKFWGLTESEWWDKFIINNVHLADKDLIPGLGVRLTDPFDKVKDVTAWKKIKGITVWSGKIDWLLYDYDKLSVINKCVSNTDASDHQYLLCDIKAKSL